LLKVSEFSKLDYYRQKDKKESKPILKVEKTSRLQGAINLELFLSAGKLKICDTKEKKSEELKNCISHLMLDREIDWKKDLKMG
jgi:hypothetical protein